MECETVGGDGSIKTRGWAEEERWGDRQVEEARSLDRYENTQVEF